MQIYVDIWRWRHQQCCFWQEAYLQSGFNGSWHKCSLVAIAKELQSYLTRFCPLLQGRDRKLTFREEVSLESLFRPLRRWVSPTPLCSYSSLRLQLRLRFRRLSPIRQFFPHRLFLVRLFLAIQPPPPLAAGFHPEIMLVLCILIQGIAFKI